MKDDTISMFIAGLQMNPRMLCFCLKDNFLLTEILVTVNCVNDKKLKKKKEIENEILVILRLHK